MCVELVETTSHCEAVVGLPQSTGPREEGAPSITKDASTLTLILHRGPTIPVFVLEVQLHMSDNSAVVQRVAREAATAWLVYPSPPPQAPSRT